MLQEKRGNNSRPGKQNRETQKRAHDRRPERGPSWGLGFRAFPTLNPAHLQSSQIWRRRRSLARSLGRGGRLLGDRAHTHPFPGRPSVALPGAQGGPSSPAPPEAHRWRHPRHLKRISGDPWWCVITHLPPCFSKMLVATVLPWLSSASTTSVHVTNPEASVANTLTSSTVI